MQYKEAMAVLIRKIQSGEYGNSGEKLPGVRELAEELQCSYVTACKAVESVCESHQVLSLGNCRYITTGRCALNSPLEKRLQLHRKNNFAIQVPTLDNHYFSKQAQIIYQQLLASHQNVNVIIGSSNPDLEKAQLREILEMNMSGLFYFPHKDFLNRQLYECYPLPVVAIGRLVDHYRRSVIMVDNYHVGQIAAMHLLSKSYEDYAYIGYQHSDDMPDLRLNGFRDTLSQNGIALQKKDILLISRGDSERYIQSMIVFLQSKIKATGIFCYHDLLAGSLLQTILHMNCTVPDQYGIIGCDDLPIASSVTPTLSTVRYPFAQIGELAIQTMYEELESGQSIHKSLGVKPKVIERASTARQ